MAASRSFTDYVRKKYDNEFWAVAEQFLEDNPDYIESLATRVHSVGETEISDVHVEYVWVDDQPDMEISFDVALSVNVEIHEGNHHYDSTEERMFWLMVSCRGNLSKKLDDFEIMQVSKYNGKNRAKDPMDDSLVPIIPYDKLETVAENFLKRNFPEALNTPQRGQPPVWVDPTELAKSLTLTIQSHRIKENSSVFGQIYFEDTDADIYDEDADEDVSTHVDGRTILVDPLVYLLRNIGSVNTTIIHECVHWDRLFIVKYKCRLLQT